VRAVGTQPAGIEVLEMMNQLAPVEAELHDGHRPSTRHGSLDASGEDDRPRCRLVAA